MAQQELPNLTWDGKNWVEDTPENRSLGLAAIQKEQPESQIQSAAKAKAMAQSPWQNFLSGAGGELGALKEGATALFSEPNPEAMQSAAVNQSLPNYSPAAYAGQLAGTLGASMGLGYPIAMGLGMAARIPGLAGIGGPIATNAATGAAYEALKAQGDRGEAAALGALGGVMGPTVLKAAGGVRNVHPYAQQLLDEGVPLRPGMVAAGKITGPMIRMAEQGAEAAPIAGAFLRAQSMDALRGWDKHMLKRVAPNPAGVTKTGYEGVHQVQQQFNHEYDRLMGMAPERIGSDSWKTFENITNIADAAIPDLTAESAEKLMKDVYRLRHYVADGFPRESIKKLKNEYYELAKGQYGKDFTLHHTYKAIAKEIDEALQRAMPSPELAAELKVLDFKKSQLYPLEAAHAVQSALTTDVMTPNQFMRALVTDAGPGGKQMAASGQLFQQPEAFAANQVFEQVIPRMGPGTAERLLTGGGLTYGIGNALYNPSSIPLMLGTGAGLTAVGLAAKALRPMMTGQSWITPYARGLYDASQRYAPGALAMPGIAAMESWQ